MTTIPSRRSEPLFTIPEVAQMFQVSTKTVRRWIDAGERRSGPAAIIHRRPVSPQTADVDHCFLCDSLDSTTECRTRPVETPPGCAWADTE